MKKDVILSDIIASTIEKAIESDLQKYVDKEVKECLARVIDDLFGYNSEARKNLKQKFSEQIGVCFENLKVENYNSMILNAIQDSINDELGNRIQETVKEGILSRIAILEKKTYKLSEIVEKFKTEVLKDMDDYESRELTVVVEKSSTNFIYIYLDTKEYQDKYQCKYQIATYKGKVFNCHPIFEPHKEHHGFENFLFALNANAVIVEVDDYDTHISKGEYD